MSKKRNKKLKENETNLPAVIEKTPTKKEQLAFTLFDGFLKKTMKIYNYVNNDYIEIIPYMDKNGEEKDDGSDIVCYEISPKSNKNVVVYVDDKDIYMSLKSSGIILKDEEAALLVANIIGYIKSYCQIAA